MVGAAASGPQHVLEWGGAFLGDARAIHAEGRGLDPVGRISGGRIGELQRARILGAMVEVVRERGLANVAVAHVVERSGVSRRTFYELFEDREACFMAAFDAEVSCGAQRVVPAYSAGGTQWRERVRAGLAALLEWLDENPAAGALCVVDTLAGGAVVLDRRAQVVDALVDVVHEGCLESIRTCRPRRLVAEGVVGAVLALLHARLATGDPAPLSGLLSQLTAVVILPYLGPAVADRELTRRAPRKRRVKPSPMSPGDPLRDLNMRLTYRTVRVLLAVAELSASGLYPSGRSVAAAAGVGDQGQMSKLLRRLEHVGLVANAAAHPRRGAPNAWMLTDMGKEVERVIRARTEMSLPRRRLES